MSFAISSATSSTFLPGIGLCPLEINFDETARNLKVAMDRSSHKEIEDYSQKLNNLILEMQKVGFQYTEKYRDQATGLIAQAEAVLSAHKSTLQVAEEDLCAELNALPDLSEQCVRWFKLASQAENPAAILGKIKNGMVKSFTSVQVAFLISSKHLDQTLNILKDCVTDNITYPFYTQVVHLFKQDELALLPVNPKMVFQFVNNLQGVKESNAMIYQLPLLSRQELEALNSEALLDHGDIQKIISKHQFRSIQLNTLLMSIPSLAKIYMEDLQSNEEEKLHETVPQYFCETLFKHVLSECNSADFASSVDQQKICYELLQAFHQIRSPFPTNYWARLPQKIGDILMKKRF